jgi:hypothetical protein
VDNVQKNFSDLKILFKKVFASRYTSVLGYEKHDDILTKIQCMERRAMQEFNYMDFKSKIKNIFSNENTKKFPNDP